MSAKLPIPRLQHKTQGIAPRRTSQACAHCQRRKMKCDGGRPFCSQCRSHGLLDCVYPEKKIIRQQKELVSVQKEVEAYRNLLRDISEKLEGPVADQISITLKNPSDTQNQQHENHAKGPSSSSSSSSSSLSSPEKSDLANEDYNRNAKSRATGHIGENSEIAWMQPLDSQSTQRRDENAFSNTTQWPQLAVDNSIASMNYHLDHLSISNPKGTDAFVLPPKELADHLFQVYLDKVHISLPFIRPDLFVDQFHRCYSMRVRSPGKKWLTVFNMVLAIGCAFKRLSGQDPPREADECVFSARAQCLSLSESVLYDHDDLQQVQAEALMAFLSLIQSQANRSWKMIGIAARSGIALGLNLQKNISGLDVISNEARKSLWWSIFRLENLLSVMTGRVSCLGKDSCSTSPPLLTSILEYTGTESTQSIKELQWTIHLGQSQMISQVTCLKSTAPSASLFFFYMVDLSLITQSIINQLYPTRRSLTSWAKVEKRMNFYSRKVEIWKASLHPTFCFQDSQSYPLGDIRSPFQISLAFSYYSIQILLYRPSINNSLFETRDGSQNARALFDNKTARNCLRASLEVISLLPDQPDLDWCYEVLQWWDLLHVLIQAILIILLDISAGSLPTTTEVAAFTIEPTSLIWAQAKKGLLWLDCLGKTSEAARRASQFFHTCILRMDLISDVHLDSSTIQLSKTSRLSDSPWPQGSSYGATASLQQGIQVTEDSRKLKSTDSPRESDINQEMMFQDSEEYKISSAELPSACTVLDADLDMPELTWSPKTNIEDVLLSMVDFHS